jgi:hypothetical protein
MRASRILAVVFQLAALAACGGSTSTSTPDGGSNAGPDANAGDARGDSASADAANDGGCPSETSALCFGQSSQGCCGQDPEGPATCVGGVWMCGSAPAPGCNGTSCAHPGSDASTGFACGPLTCDPATQYCSETVGGINGPGYNCSAIPTACQLTPTCACINIPACTCTEQGGAVTVQCQVG